MILLVFLVFSCLATFALYGFNAISYDGRFLIPVGVFLLAFLACVLLYFLFLFVLFAFVNKEKPIKKPGKFYYGVYLSAVGLILNVSNVSVKLKGGEKLDNSKNYLFVFNHRSNFDPLVVAKVLKKHRPLMISKPENLKTFMVGGCMHKLGFMPIDRENDREALKTIIKSVGRLKEGYSIGIFPEGTRNKTGEGLLPMKNGAFKIATKAKKPIAVLSILGAEKIVKNAPFKRTYVEIEVLTVIEPEEFNDNATLDIGDRVEKTLLQKINEN